MGVIATRHDVDRCLWRERCGTEARTVRAQACVAKASSATVQPWVQPDAHITNPQFRTLQVHGYTTAGVGTAPDPAVNGKQRGQHEEREKHRLHQRHRHPTACQCARRVSVRRLPKAYEREQACGGEGHDVDGSTERADDFIDEAGESHRGDN